MATQKEIKERRRKELVKKIRTYLKRCIKDKGLERHNLETDGLWELYGGRRLGTGKYKLIEKVRGKYVDAVAFLVQDDSYFSQRIFDPYKLDNNVSYYENGFICLVKEPKVHRLRDSGLAEEVRRFRKSKKSNGR